jgi:hypothetical protein
MFNHIYPPNPETKIHQTSINININQNPKKIALPSQPIPALLPRDKNGAVFPVVSAPVDGASPAGLRCHWRPWENLGFFFG